MKDSKVNEQTSTIANQSFDSTLKFNSNQHFGNISQIKSPLFESDFIQRNEEDIYTNSINDQEKTNDNLKSSTFSKGESIIKVVKNEIYKKHIPINPSEITSININSNREKSPKTINIGESKEETEYNIRILTQKQKTPIKTREEKEYNNINKNSKYPIENYYPGDEANYPIAVPIQCNIQNTIDYIGNNQDIQYYMYPRDIRENINLNEKLSPKGNAYDDSISDYNKIDTSENQLNNLKNQMNINQKYDNTDVELYDGVNEEKKNINYINTIKKNADNQSFNPNNINENNEQIQLKKLIKLMSKDFNPNIRHSGRLINTNQTIISGVNGDILTNDNNRLLQKIKNNKLSKILLKNRESISSKYDQSIRGTLEISKTTKHFDKGTLNNLIINKRETIKTPQNKFLYLSLAMLSSKGLNTEDRTILRKMRFDKGGVVDLAQEKMNKKGNQFKIKNSKPKNIDRKNNKNSKLYINPKYREKAAKIIQNWWRNLKEIYLKQIKHVIKIQSYWRGRWFRKNIYDILYLNLLCFKFSDTISHALVNKIRKEIFDLLFPKRKLIKKDLGKLLEELNYKNNLSILKNYLKKWIENVKLIRNKIIKGKFIIDKREENEKNMKMLKQYFNDWSMKSLLLKYIGLSKDVEVQKKRFYATIDLIDSIKKFWKKIGFNYIMPYLKDYLFSLEKNKKLKKIVKKINKYKIIQLKNSFNKWKNNVYKYQFKGFKSSILKNLLNRIDNKYNRIIKKKFFDKWKKSNEKDNYKINNNILNCIKASELIKKYYLKQIPVNNFKDFIQKRKNLIRNKKISSILKISNKNLKHFLNVYLNKWYKQGIKLKYCELIDKLFSLIIDKIYLKWRLMTISNIFYKLHKKINKNIDINSTLKKYKILFNALNKLSKISTKETKIEFLNKIKKISYSLMVKKIGNKIYSKYSIKDRIKLNYYFYKWRDITNSFNIQGMKTQLFKYLFRNKDFKSKKLCLSKFFNRWKLFTIYSEKYDNIEKLKQVRKGYDKIHLLYINRCFYFLMKLVKYIKLNYKPLYLKSFFKKWIIDKPKYVLKNYLDKWLKNSLLEGYKKTILNFKSIILKNSSRRIKERSNRDLLLKSFFKWKNDNNKKENYYLNIIKGLDKLSHYSKNIIFQQTYSRIKNTKNKKKYIIRIVKYKTKNEKKDEEMVRKLFNKWRNNKEYNKKEIQNLKGKIIFKTKNNLNKKILSTYFSKWKLINTKILNKSLSKVLNSIFNKVSSSKIKSQLQKNILHKYLMVWLKKSLSNSIFRKIKTRLRRIIKNKQKNLLLKAYQIWSKKSIKIKIKEKNIEKSKKIISNRIKEKTKLLLYKKLNKWRNKINYLRERDLKANLIFKIKNTQNIKIKTNEKFKMHLSFLRWINKCHLTKYKNINNPYENIKAIKKGYKLMQKVLKKRYQPNFYYCLKESLKKLRREKLLKNFIKNSEPKSALRKKNKVIKNWLNKIPDTNRMKLKIRNLFKNYLLTKKINDKIFKEAKNSFVELFTGFENIKRKNAKNIINFFNTILKSKKRINKMKLRVLLNKIFKKKEKSYQKIKKIYLLNFFRNTQKLLTRKYAQIILNFLKKKTDFVIEKKRKFGKALKLINTYIRKKTFKNLKTKINVNKKRDNLLLKFINKKKVINKKLLSNILQKWKNSTKILAANKIQNSFRKYRSKKKLNNIKQLKKRLVEICSYQNFKMKKFKSLILHKWNRKIKSLNNISNMELIQNFIRENMKYYFKKENQNKLRKIFRKKLIFQIVNSIKQSKRILGKPTEILFITLEEILLKKPYNKLKKSLKFLSRKKVLIKLYSKIKKYKERFYLPVYLNKWKKNSYEITLNNSKKIRNYLSKKIKIKKEKKIKKRDFLLNKLITKLINDKKLLLRVPFKIWNKKVKVEKLNKKVNIIQKALNKYKKKMKIIKIEYSNNLKKLFREYIIKNISDYFIESSKFISSFDDSMQLINGKIEKRYSLNNMITDNNLKYRIKCLKQLLNKNLSSNKKSVLNKFYNKWKQYSLLSNKFANKIQKALKKYKEKIKRKKKLNNFLLKILSKKINNNSTKIKESINKWNKKTNNLQTNVKRLIKSIIIQIKKIIMKKIKDLSKKKFLKKICEKINLKFNYLLLKKELTKIRSKIKTLKVKDKKFIDSLNRIENRKIIISLKYLNNIFLIKKLIHDINRVKAKNFFSKLKNMRQLQKKFNQLGISLEKSNNSIIQKNKEKFILKMKKLYVYRKLSKLFNYYNNYIQTILKRQSERKFFNILKTIKTNKNQEYAYKNKKISSNKPPITKMSFRSKSKDKEKKRNADKLSKIKKLIPYFIKYLQKKILLRKKKTFQTLKYYYTNQLYKNYLKKKIKKEKLEFMKLFKNTINNKKKKELRQKQLKNLFNRKYHKLIYQILIKSNRIYLLFYLIKIVIFHKMLSKKKFIREIIRKWRYLNFVKQIAKRKLDLMYKNMHTSYLQMANDLFGNDNEKNPSIMKEFERFNSNLGMFSEDDSLNDKLGKKYFSNVHKNYSFNKNIFNDKYCSESKNSSSSRFEKIDDSNIQNDDFKIDELEPAENNYNYFHKHKKH